MGEALEKLKNLRDKYGLRGTLRLLADYLRGAASSALGPGRAGSREILRALERELRSGRCERVVLRRGSFGWHTPLFQRPQQLARAMGRCGCLVLYEAVPPRDRLRGAEKMGEGLWLVNLRCPGLRRGIERAAVRSGLPRYLQLASPESRIPLRLVRRYAARGWTLLYDYIDEISGEISASKAPPRATLALYRYAMARKDAVVIASSLALRRDAERRRGPGGAVLAENGVDFARFSRPMPCPEDEEFRSLLRRGRPRLGFYGALARWLDYEALRTLAADGRFDLVLFGVRYDGSFDAELAGRENVFFLGPRPYETLPAYAARCDVLLIPFRKGAVGDAASPVKLFEYLALGRPVVAGDVAECRRCESVLIASTPRDYVRCVERALALARDADYLAREREEAHAADWLRRAESVRTALQKREKQGGI